MASTQSRENRVHSQEAAAAMLADRRAAGAEVRSLEGGIR